jgi:hypothetical protein
MRWGGGNAALLGEDQVNSVPRTILFSRASEECG